MIKKIAKPFQVVLLKRGLCSACTHPLDKSPRDSFRENRAMVTCKCKRRYVYNMDTDIYRRATFEEEKEYLNKKKISQ